VRQAEVGGRERRLHQACPASWPLADVVWEPDGRHHQHLSAAQRPPARQQRPQQQQPSEHRWLSRRGRRPWMGRLQPGPRRWKMRTRARQRPCGERTWGACPMAVSCKGFPRKLTRPVERVLYWGVCEHKALHTRETQVSKRVSHKVVHGRGVRRDVRRRPNSTEATATGGLCRGRDSPEN
jgi:hypothetical protein